MFEKFTDRARKVMQIASQEAQRLNSEYIGTEHVVMGLSKEGSGVASHVLQALGVSVAKLQVEIEKLLLPAANPPSVCLGRLPYTPKVKEAIEKGSEEAKALGHNYVGTEHLLLGLLGVECTAREVMTNCGLKAEDIRKGIIELVTPAKADQKSLIANVRYHIGVAEWAINGLKNAVEALGKTEPPTP